MESDKHDAQWAIDLLSPDPYYKPHLIAKYALQIPSFVVGPGFACYINYIKGFKPFARPYLHVGYTAGLLIAAYYADGWWSRKNARRDAFLRDYIRRHPEDFPEPERKKYGELFLEWLPIR